VAERSGERGMNAQDCTLRTLPAAISVRPKFLRTTGTGCLNIDKYFFGLRP
jgi:hypothetical protein